MKHLIDSYPLRSMLFYPRRDVPRDDPNDGTIPVDDDVELGYRYYPSESSRCTIVFFHGNGEIVSDYDNLVPFYHRIGAAFLAIDYRGYGWSSGQPRSSALFDDVTPIREALPHILPPDQPLILMGRSLGSISAIHMTHLFPDLFKGLIIESGLAHALLVYFPLRRVLTAWLPDLFGNLRKIRQIETPLLIIHGQRDRVLPVRNGQKLYDASPAPIKTLCRIPDAGHNDLLMRAADTYFTAIDAFLDQLLALGQ